MKANQEKAKRLIREISAQQPDLFAADISEKLDNITEAMRSLAEGVSVMGKMPEYISQSLEPMILLITRSLAPLGMLNGDIKKSIADMEKGIQLTVSGMKPKDLDLTPVIAALQSLKNTMDARNPEQHHNRMIDALNAGFKRLEAKLESGQISRDDIAEAMKIANQPLIDQNVEKINIMKDGGGKEGKTTVISGGMVQPRIAHASTIQSGTVTVSSSGTAVALSSTPAMCSRVNVAAHESNTGTIVVGGSDVVAALSGRKGYPLYPSQSYEIPINDLSKIYVDSTVSGDKVTFVYIG